MRCWLFGHEPLLKQRRDANGRPVKPHVVEWECGICFKALGTTTLAPKFRLIATLRREVARLRKTA